AVETEAHDLGRANGERLPAPRSATTRVSATPASGLDGLLGEPHVVLIDDPVSKADVIRRLVEVVAADVPTIKVQDTVERLAEGDRQGSTLLNEGVALPHCRLPGLPAPQVALAVTKAGVLDAPTDHPIEVVFLLLSPAEESATHLQLLAKAGRALQNR